MNGFRIESGAMERKSMSATVEIDLNRDKWIKVDSAIYEAMESRGIAGRDYSAIGMGHLPLDWPAGCEVILIADLAAVCMKLGLQIVFTDVEIRPAK